MICHSERQNIQGTDAFWGNLKLSAGQKNKNGEYLTFGNVYDDARRAEAYARLEFPGSYYLAYRDLPDIFSKYVTGMKALDFGCGTGRSTRFLKGLGFAAAGVDTAENMLRLARAKDPDGDYLQVKDGSLEGLKESGYDLILSAFTFDNIHTHERKVGLFQALRDKLKRDGKIVNLVSSPDIYKHEWASFSTSDFPENHHAKSGDKVKIIMKDVDDHRPVIDILWTDESYLEVYKQAGLELLETHRPLGRADEPYNWINETKIAPWVIYVLGQ